MSSDPTRDRVQKRYTIITDLERGDSVETAASYLVNEGWDEHEALAFVTVIRDEQAAGRPVIIEHPPSDEDLRNADTRRLARRNMTIGGLLFGGGAFITFITYLASDATGSYIVAYGAMFWGGWRFLIGYNANRRLENSKR